MGPRLRKLALAAHPTASVWWVGAVLGFLPFPVIGAASSRASTVRAALVGQAWLVPHVVVPAVGGLGVLPVVQLPGVLEPQGRTGYGQRRSRAGDQPTRG